MKEVSVVLTAYMLGDYIEQAINSVLAQTFQDYELIIVDDGSTDNTREKVAGFGDPRIKYIYQTHSGLPGKTRNKGIAASSGRFIAFLDGDDIWYSNKLKRCLEALKADNAIDIICHDVNYLRRYDEKVFRRSFFGPYEQDMYRQLLLKGNTLATSSTVIRRSIFLQDQFSFSEEPMFTTAEEFDLWLRLAKSEKYRFSYLPEVLTEHRIRENSVTLADIEKAASNMLYLLKQNITELNSTQAINTLVKKRRSQIMLGAALAFNYRGEFGKSVNWHLKTIREYPRSWKPYFSLFASLLKIKLGYL